MGTGLGGLDVPWRAPLLIVGCAVLLGSLAAVPIRRERSSSGYVLEVAVMWSAFMVAVFTVAVFIGMSRVWDDVYTVTIPLAMVTALVGMLLRNSTDPLPSATGSVEPR
jgi:hypothetical protein